MSSFNYPSEAGAAAAGQSAQTGAEEAQGQ